MEKIYGDEYNKDFDTYAKTGAAVTFGGMLIGGIGKGIAKHNQKKAERIYGPARDRYISSLSAYEESIERTKKTITGVVCLKKRILHDHMMRFLKAYKRLAPQIKLRDSQGLGELQRFVFGQDEFQEIGRLTDVYLSYNELELGERAADVALLLVQDGTVSNLAYSVRDIIYAGINKDEDLKRNSMDELKIQSIGAIAQFSSVAVEFGLSGMSDAFNSGKQLNNAKETAARYERRRELIEINNTKVNAIGEYANIHLKLLNRFVPLMEEYVTRTVQIIKRRDNIFHFGRIQERKFTQYELEVLAFTFSLVGAVKTVIDSPIISQNGEVFTENNSDFDEVLDCVDIFERRSEELSA